MNNKFFIYLFLFLFFNTYSYSLELQGEFTEGALIKGKVKKDTKIFISKYLSKYPIIVLPIIVSSFFNKLKYFFTKRP